MIWATNYLYALISHFPVLTLHETFCAPEIMIAWKNSKIEASVDDLSIILFCSIIIL